MKRIFLLTLSLLLSACAGQSTSSCDAALECSAVHNFKLLLLPAEPIIGIGSLVSHRPQFWLRQNSLPRGSGQLIVAIPGLGTSDLAFKPMISSLNQLGFNAYTWNQGMSSASFEKNEAAFVSYLKTLQRKHSRKIHLVGWSIGGSRALHLANRYPDLIHSVITLGTPYRQSPVPSVLPNKLDEYVYREVCNLTSDISCDIPITSVYGYLDSLVRGLNGALVVGDEQSCQRESVGVMTSHFGLGFSFSVLEIVANTISSFDN